MSKTFESGDSLKIHVLEHIGTKPFECLECEKVFHHKNIFNYHMKIHSDEKAFKCNICGRSFELDTSTTS